jgi:hypothetical protein
MDGIPDQGEINDIVDDIKSGANAVNRRITRAYHQLSEAIRLDLDAGPNLDWCGFAKWSSHTVGFDLNPNLVGTRVGTLADSVSNKLSDWILEFLPDELLKADLLPARLRETNILGSLLSAELLQKALREVTVKLLQQAADVEDGLVVNTLRLGNAAIFSEMGSVFVRLVERLPERRMPTAQSDREFADEVIKQIMSLPGRSALPPLSPEMLELAPPGSLAQGIEFYLRAGREPKHRAELMLAGSMLFSEYEQTRADRLITVGTCAPVRARLIPLIKALSGVSPADVLLAGQGHDHSIIRNVETAVARRLTDEALVVKIDDVSVRLGHPKELPAPQITPTLPETVEVMDRMARRAAGRARNWIDLNYRLGFIGQYFAAFQQKPEAIKEPSISA